jgi:hypothetical protein
MQELQTPSRSEVLSAFTKADDKGKQLLESLFGKIVPENITDKVKSFEDACTVLGIDPADVLHSSHSQFLDKHISSINAYCKLIVITSALNEGWIPDWDDDSEEKHYPWFFMQGSGFRLYDVYYGYHDSNVGSRLCFRDSSLAEYAAKQFNDIYKEFMLIQN